MIPFEDHIMNEHYIYKYFYYITYLDWKESVYYTGIDIYVSNCLKSNYKDEWIPKENTKGFGD